jgi:hypothetical protein
MVVFQKEKDRDKDKGRKTIISNLGAQRLLMANL